jgi:26S proteasome regulatory subunit N5
MRWPGIESLYGASLRSTKVFGSTGVNGIEGDIEETSTSGNGDKRWEELHNRVVEHVRSLSPFPLSILRTLTRSGQQ